LTKDHTRKGFDLSELIGQVVVDMLAPARVITVHDIIESLHSVMEITENQSRRENCKLLIETLARKMH
jgi:hypoxanthine-guanine phosphoribosyltransferase